MLRAPFHGTPKDYAIAGGLAAGILLASSLDRTVRGEVQGWHDGWLRTVDDVGYDYHLSSVTFVTAGGLYAAGLISGGDGLRRTGVEIVEAFCFAHAGTQTVKHLAGRHRPYNNDGPFVFSGPVLEDRYLSFPSGDVTNAFAFSTVLASELQHPAATVILYSLASATLFQRLHRDRHWLSDTLGGAIWSTAVARAVVLYNRQQNRHRSALELAPEPGGGGSSSTFESTRDNRLHDPFSPRSLFTLRAARGSARSRRPRAAAGHAGKPRPAAADLPALAGG